MTQSPGDLSSSQGQQQLSSGAIAGIALACTVIGSLLIAGLIWIFIHTRRRRLRTVRNVGNRNGKVDLAVDRFGFTVSAPRPSMEEEGRSGPRVPLLYSKFHHASRRAPSPQPSVRSSQSTVSEWLFGRTPTVHAGPDQSTSQLDDAGSIYSYYGLGGAAAVDDDQWHTATEQTSESMRLVTNSSSSHLNLPSIASTRSTATVNGLPSTRPSRLAIAPFLRTLETIPSATEPTTAPSLLTTSWETDSNSTATANTFALIDKFPVPPRQPSIIGGNAAGESRSRSRPGGSGGGGISDRLKRLSRSFTDHDKFELNAKLVPFGTSLDSKKHTKAMSLDSTRSNRWRSGRSANVQNLNIPPPPVLPPPSLPPSIPLPSVPLPSPPLPVAMTDSNARITAAKQHSSSGNGRKMIVVPLSPPPLSSMPIPPSHLSPPTSTGTSSSVPLDVRPNGDVQLHSFGARPLRIHKKSGSVA